MPSYAHEIFFRDSISHDLSDVRTYHNNQRIKCRTLRMKEKKEKTETRYRENTREMFDTA